ncbi:response regulator receiver domain [Erwinia sp. MYb375]|uniref:response regulator receiver domain n=1 Tax=unclassified Erwinia TaxID=2622719 RepID=UPI0030A3CFEB
MTEMTQAYSNLIKEAFITPIRTVTVIDDEYPTFLSLLDSKKQVSLDVESASSNTDRLKKIIAMCHYQRHWSIDILDGSTPNVGGKIPVPSHIRHSDLVILDYHLDGDGSVDGGKRARRIIQQLDQSNHYNLTLVHTKGQDDDINIVFTEILKDFICISNDNQTIPSEATIEKINKWLDENEDGIKYQWINESISLVKVLKIFLSPESLRCINPRVKSHPLHAFSSEISHVAKQAGLSEIELMQWLFTDILTKNEIVFGQDARMDLQFDWSEETNFISTGKIFISVIRKENTEDLEEELIGSLSKALTKHNASPMQLLMAKIRFELDEKGIEQASKIISNRYAQAGWLYNLLKNSNDDSAHDKAINLHWEQLATASRLELRDFSKKIMNIARETFPSDEKKFVKHFFHECMTEQDITLGHLNAFSCSMPVCNSHLMTGSVLDIEGEKWVCITPACDLVPGQKKTQWGSRIGESYLVFKAVRFEKANLNTANKKANFNEYIYLNVDDKPEAYCLGGENPCWDTFYAVNQGRYVNSSQLCILSVRENNSPDAKFPLEMKELQVNVIAELRYEYALNLLHKFGSSQTRVGLDFQNKESMW